MKKSIILGALVLGSLAFTSCDDFLDDNRYPLDQQTNSPAYWDNPDNVKMQCDQMLQYFTGYSSGSSYGEFYFNTLTDDQCSSGYTNWKNTSIPSTSTSWTSPYTNIRHSATIIANLESSKMDAAQKNNYLGIARMCRAYQQYLLVRRYGDCYFVEDPVDISDDAILYGPRQSRDEVFAKILEDLDFACNNITVNKNSQYWSRDLAYAMKSYMCLCEATYRKYCTQAENGIAPDATLAKKYFEEAAKASDYLINSGRYSVAQQYRANYQSFYTTASAVPAMVNNPEMILFRAYAKDIIMNCVQDYTCSTTPINGITKDAFDAYLFKDGKPKALTSYSTNDEAVWDDTKKVLSIQHLLDMRDNRLAMTTDPTVYYTGLVGERAGAEGMTSSTGYGVSKYDNTELPVADRRTIYNTVCAPIYWYSVILLENAEAKAELGTLTDADLNRTLNLLYKRAQLPAQTVASLSSMNDPANNMGVSSLLWEVRRCRRCELIMDNDFRYWDLVRWHQLPLIDPANNPNIWLGANITKSPVQVKTTNGYINGDINYPGRTRKFEPQYYSYPIPQNQINLNKEIGQNYLWKN